MAPATRLCLLLPLARPVASSSTRLAAAAAAARAIHTNPAQPAKVVPVYGTGPPPEPPQPTDEFAAEEREARLARRRKHAALLKQAGDVKALKQQQQQQQQDSASGKSKTGGLKRRFWKDVHVREVNVDNLVSASQATKQHLIPLTSLVCRALDIAADDAAATSQSPTIRASITTTLLRYLDTDSLLCFAPPPNPGDHDPSLDGPTLRERQEQAYAATASYLQARIWPGVSIVPVLDETSILPRHQAPGTREVVQGWILSLSPFELAALERGTLAGKSLLAAARLVVEWSEEGAHAQAPATAPAAGKAEEKFGVEEAAQAVSLEVAWQTGRWGEVEDTHDVEKEDLRRQLGSVVLLVAGKGTGSKSG
ncbi:hypothetical protein NEMBOFW57_001759 [Staphylotrichum longicolle]|uniref:Uncharacterized protein n=1 Tax=Staphylotrichum longicolle TaxID=669026 RepID=A0AAD4HY47_9PEZI|nr:hypothetical protein NEMBOFW57_001759 [Staphylotrichum longicolle]